MMTRPRSTSSRWVATMRPPCLRCRTSSTSTWRPRRTQSSALGCLQSPRKSGQVWISHTTVQQHPAREEVPGLVRDARLHHSHGSHPGAVFLAPAAEEILCPVPPDDDLRVWTWLITLFEVSASCEGARVCPVGVKTFSGTTPIVIQLPLLASLLDRSANLS